MALFWQILTFPPKVDLIQAKDQCHQAIQNVAAVGRSFLPVSKRDEHANLEWDFKLQRLIGQWIEGETVFRSSFSVKDFTVYLVNRHIETISSNPLQDIRQREVMVWLEHELSKLGQDLSKINLRFPYDFPEYPTARKESFHIDNQEAVVELSRYYHNTAMLLQKIKSQYPQNSSTIKCWPQHFDIATSITLFDSGDHETSKRINVGFSPGDENIDEPYFYVSPWPYPRKTLPDISDTMGYWHTNDWIGAILPSYNLKMLRTNYDQQTAIFKFYETSIKVLKSLL